MLEKTKEGIKKEKITPLQLILFGMLVGFMVISNLKSFRNLAVGWQLGIQLAFYIGIMLTAGATGNVTKLVKQIIAIIGNGDTDEVKMLKLQNLVVAMCQELGLMYEKEKEKLFDHIADTIIPNVEEEEDIEVEV